MNSGLCFPIPLIRRLEVTTVLKVKVQLFLIHKRGEDTGQTTALKIGKTGRQGVSAFKEETSERTSAWVGKPEL